jgi:hypothetical protein
LGTTTVPEDDPADAPEVDPVDAPEDPVDAPEVDPADAPEVDPADAPEVAPEVDPVDAPEVDPVDASESDPVDTPEVDPAAALPESALPEVDPDMSTTPDEAPDEGAAPDVAPAEDPLIPMSPELATPLELATPELGWAIPASSVALLASPVAQATRIPLAKAPKRQTLPICVIAHRRMTYLKSTEWMVVGARIARAPRQTSE